MVSPDARQQAVGKVARQMLKERLALVVKRLRQAARRGRKAAEGVHQLRVVTRRARAVLDVFEAVLPRRQAAWFRRRLRELRRAASDARNLDVFLARLSAEGVTLSPTVSKQLAGMRKQAHQEVRNLDDKLRRKRRWADRRNKLFERMRTKRKQASWSQPLASFAPEALRPVADEFIKRLPMRSATAERLHQLRVAGKRLRYTLEVLEPALPVRPCQALLVELVKLQDELGQINDAATAAAILSSAPQQAHEARPWYRARLRHEQQLLAGLRLKFQKRWSKSRQQRLQKLCQAVSGSVARKSTQRPPPPAE